MALSLFCGLVGESKLRGVRLKDDGWDDWRDMTSFSLRREIDYPVQESSSSSSAQLDMDRCWVVLNTNAFLSLDQLMQRKCIFCPDISLLLYCLLPSSG